MDRKCMEMREITWITADQIIEWYDVIVFSYWSRYKMQMMMFPIDWLYTSSTWESRGRKFQGASIYKLKHVSISVLTFRLFTTKPGLLLQWKRPVGKLIGKDWQMNFCVLNFESSTSLNIIFPCHFLGIIFWDAGNDSRHLNYVVCLSNPRSEDRCTVLVIF